MLHVEPAHLYRTTKLVKAGPQQNNTVKIGARAFHVQGIQCISLHVGGQLRYLRVMLGL